jgi:hypothetical protein
MSRGLLVQHTSDIVCDLLNATAAAQIAVERAAYILLIQSEEDMDAWRLDVSVDHRDVLALLNQAAGQIGGEIGLAGISTKGVDGDDGRYYVGSSCPSFEVVFPLGLSQL